MIKGIGIDLIEVARLARLLAEEGPDFAGTLFTPAEIAYCEGKHKPAMHLAARFAAKEAAFKALARAGGPRPDWRDVEVVSGRDGRPSLALHGRARALADKLGVSAAHVSLTHTRDLAMAGVVLEG
jgi:holo-[acyl-carrier protein] synthase